MSRAIDSDALEKEGWSLHRTIRVDKNTDEYQTKPLRKVPTIEPEPQWIPVTKRLPNREEYIRCNGLFIVSDGDRTYAEYFDIYDKKCFGEPVMHGFRADRAVTAWMPLPEPYAERRTNE